MTFAATASAAPAPSFAATAASPEFRFERETWLAIRSAWKTVARAKEATASQHAAYTLLRGASLEKAFTPIRNPAKITSNGNSPTWHRDHAVRAALRGDRSALAPWAALLQDAASSKNGRHYEGAHPLLDALRAEATRQGFTG